MQTPHYFYSPDPVQPEHPRRRGSSRARSDLFYGVVQKGNDYLERDFLLQVVRGHPAQGAGEHATASPARRSPRMRTPRSSSSGWVGTRPI
ncbi:hypothetical protein ACRAWD_26970 [Caulobacter segnis]